MFRLNLTLDADTKTWLQRHAKPARRAALARTLICEGIARREALARRKKLAADYAAGRPDALALLADIEAAALDSLDRDEA